MSRVRAVILGVLSEYETLLRTAVKAAAALLLPAVVCAFLPVPALMVGPAALIGAAAVGAAFPDPFLILIGCVYAVAGLAAHAPEAGICGAAVIVLLLLVFFSFGARKSLTAALFLIAMFLKIPFAVLAPAALLGGAPSAAACLLAAAGWQTAAVFAGSPASSGFSAENLERVPQMLEGLAAQPSVLFGTGLLFAGALVIVVIGLIPANGSKFFAAGAGALCYLLLSLMGAGILAKPVPLILADALAGLASGLCAVWLFARPDYRRAHTLYFEDDDYYYTVRAVPKIGAAPSPAEAPEDERRGRGNEEA